MLGRCLIWCARSYPNQSRRGKNIGLAQHKIRSRPITYYMQQRTELETLRLAALAHVGQILVDYFEELRTEAQFEMMCVNAAESELFTWV